MVKWIKSNFPGVLYREHPTRKDGVKRDQYFTIRYTLAGKDRDEDLGWASEDRTVAKAYERLRALKANRKPGKGHRILAEKRKSEDEKKAAKKAEAARKEKELVQIVSFAK